MPSTSCHVGTLLAHLPQDSMGEWWNVVSRTIIATTLFFGMLLAARADSAPYTEQGRRSEALYFRAGACSNQGRAQTNVSAISRKARRCLRNQGRRQTARAIPNDSRSLCIADVLHSEELTGAPIFYHLVRATLLITSPSSPAFETTVEKLISWQVPPPRQGQRFRLQCDPANLSSFKFH